MRNLLILLCLWVSVTLNAATYYIAPGGCDSNPGTLSQPFFTLNKAWSVVSAGDMIYMRGGTYRYNTTGTDISGKNGSAGNYINIWAYPGEHPIINYDNETFTTQLRGINLNSCSYIYFKGIRITSINQPAVGSIAQYGIILNDGVNNCIFEQMETDHIGGWGVVIGNNNNNDLFLNCDSHHNADPNTASYNGDSYGWSDGFEAGSHGANTSTKITFNGCRSWGNSDDGWDLRQADGVYTLINCWSFRNGYKEDGSTKGGDGVGYKLGGKTTPGTASILRTVENCLSADNRGSGYDPEPDDANSILGVAIYNSVAYHCAREWGAGFSAGGYGNSTIIRDCISYANVGPATDISTDPNCTHDHNSFDLSVTVSDGDFQSVSTTGMDGARQADGSLPNTSFLHLAAGSKLIDAGIYIGIPYTGRAPDLGAYEAGAGTAVNVIVPVFNSASVENATPSLLEMTYSSTLANIVPAASAFAVTVNTVARTVSTVAISVAKVQLTLASAIKFGDVVKVSYTKPATNPVQTTSGGLAVDLIPQTIINNLINPAKDGPITVTMTLSPNHVHKILNVVLAYSSTPTSAFSPEIIRISDQSGKLFIEQVLVTGVTSIKIPINLASGIYTVVVLSNGLEMASHRIIVY